MSSDVSQPAAQPATSSKEEHGVDYLICRECSTPCYIFEMESDKVTEALCMICGNEDATNFTAGDLEEDA